MNVEGRVQIALRLFHQSRELFKSRVTDDIFTQNIYERAIVDVLVKSKGHVKSKIW